MIYIWLGLVVVLLLLEVATKRVITIWYSISALISLILSLIIDNYIIEFIVFIFIGTLLLDLFREKTIRKINDKKKKR